MQRWKTLAFVMVGLITLLGGGLGCDRGGGAGDQGQTAVVERGSLAMVVSGTGEVTPLNKARLGFTIAGRVVEVYVEVGDSVVWGQPLAKLEASALELQLAQAQAQLASTQARLAVMQKGGRAENIASAEAALDASRQRLAAMEAGGRAEQAASARAGLESARASLDRLLAGPTQADLARAQAALDTARANLEIAQANLNELLAGPTQADLVRAQTAVDSARVALDSAEANLPLVQKKWEISVKAAENTMQRKEEDFNIQLERYYGFKLVGPPLYQDLRVTFGEDVWSVRSEVEKAWQDMVAARDDWEYAQLQQSKALADARSDIARARDGLGTAQADLDELKSRPKPEDMARAQAAVDIARANLSSAQAALEDLETWPKAWDLATAQAGVTQAENQLALAIRPYIMEDIRSQRDAVAQAENQLALAKNPYTAEDIVASQAAVDQAQAALDLAKYNLEQATLTAPFDGVVNDVLIHRGELVGGATPALVLVDPEALRIDISVDEIDIAKVELGQAAEVRLDAFPGRSYAGKVMSIAADATAELGVRSYRISLGLDQSAGIKPGMSADADIIIGEKQGVLLVPGWAVRSRAGKHLVRVQVSGEVREREVRIGDSNEQWTEIVEGLQEGEGVAAW